MAALEILLFSLAYLCGSLSSAVIVCRVYQLPDPRQAGSNNPGATNVYRLGGRIPAIITLLLDVVKGTLPVLLGIWLEVPPIALGMICLFACLGHMFPLFFEFRGGKGVATAMGTLLPISPVLTILLLICWVTVVFLSGYSSLGAIIALLLAPLLIGIIDGQYVVTVSMLCLLILLRHHTNFRRLFTGQEGKVWDKNPNKE